MADPRRVLVTLHRLDKLGVALSLDDFGTGYSSLQHLRRLPLAEVKIDRSFVLGMTTDPDDAAVVGSIIDLARALGLRVVAEGVEDDRHPPAAGRRGCEVGQGWFFARPMPADALATWLGRYRPWRAASSGRGSRTRRARPRQIDSPGSMPAYLIVVLGGIHGRHLPRGGRAPRAAVAARRHRRGIGPVRRTARRDPAGRGTGR